MREIYMHEDDYCQCECLPFDCYEFCVKQCRLINEFADKHRIGSGYTDIYVREIPPNSIMGLKILKETLYGSLSEFFPPYDQIDNPFFIKYDLGNAKNACAFGENEDAVIFFSYYQDTNFIDAIWLTFNYRLDNSSKQNIHKMFDVVSKLGSFIYVDWNIKSVFCLNETQKIDEYLNNFNSENR